ncbi:hypothetical protein B0H14DRAFT_3135225 [Mycena olivaceomarginata]|nr:hypothetical protein B0H14DRAFT_3135225 [Mycena olivaceomarginata]
MPLSLSSVNLATLAIGSFLYGMYDVLFAIFHVSPPAASHGNESLTQSRIGIEVRSLPFCHRLVLGGYRRRGKIYRLWVVWTRSKSVIVFPVCSLVAFAALLSWKIWFTTKFSIASDENNLRFSDPAPNQKFLAIVVESAGFTRTVWVILFSVTYETNSNLASFFLETAPAVVGIVNCPHPYARRAWVD